MNMTHERQERDSQRVMKDKQFYLSEGGQVNRWIFRNDLHGCAYITNLTAAQVLKEFFDQGSFSRKEMADFALNVSARGELIEGAIVLFKALDITAEQATEERILEKYFGVSEFDATLLALSWQIDLAMDWPPGTCHPASKAILAGF